MMEYLALIYAALSAVALGVIGARIIITLVDRHFEREKKKYV